MNKHEDEKTLMPNVPQPLLFAPISSLNSLRFVLKRQKKAEKSGIPILSNSAVTGTGSWR